jgi:5-methylcytosine-specific restriction endonuclease McrA
VRRAYQRAKYQRNRERYLERQRRKRAEDPSIDRERCRQYRLANRDKLLLKKRAYYARTYPEIRSRKNASIREKRAANPEAFRQKDRITYRTFNERIRQSQRRYNAAHPEMTQASVQRRLARLKNAPINDFTAAQWLEMQEHADHRCTYCQKRCKGRLEMDHLLPLSQGGHHTVSNIVPACRRCNAIKATGAPLVPVQPLLLTVAPPRKNRRQGG